MKFLRKSAFEFPADISQISMMAFLEVAFEAFELVTILFVFDIDIGNDEKRGIYWEMCSQQF